MAINLFIVAVWKWRVRKEQWRPDEAMQPDI